MATISATSKPASASASKVKKQPDLPKGESSSILEKPSSESFRPLIDWQELAPSPSQTYYQLCLYPFHAPTISPGGVEQRRERRTSKQPVVSKGGEEDVEFTDTKLNREKINRGCLVLRDWPRKRMSQTWTRDGALNPSERVIDYKSFVQDGELDTLVISVFGKERYNEILRLAKIELEKKISYE